jgi:hypothetical protein
MSSPAPPHVFDRQLLRRRLSRALGGQPPDFLLTRAADDLADRLASIRRDFPRSLDIGTPTSHFARAVAATGRQAPLRATPSLALLSGSPGLRVVADEEAPPFTAQSFDLIVSGFSLQWVNDLPGDRKSVV